MVGQEKARKLVGKVDGAAAAPTVTRPQNPEDIQSGSLAELQRTAWVVSLVFYERIVGRLPLLKDSSTERTLHTVSVAQVKKAFPRKIFWGHGRSTSVDNLPPPLLQPEVTSSSPLLNPAPRPATVDSDVVIVEAFWRYATSRIQTWEKEGTLVGEDGKVAESDAEKAEVLNDFFASVFTAEDMTSMPTIGTIPVATRLENVEITEEKAESSILQMQRSGWRRFKNSGGAVIRGNMPISLYKAERGQIAVEGLPDGFMLTKPREMGMKRLRTILTCKERIVVKVKQTRQPQHTTRLQLFDMTEIEHFSDVSSDSDDFIEEEFDPEQFLLEEFAEGIAPYRFEPYLEGPANDPGSDSESDAEERGEEGDAGGADAQIPMDIERLQNVEWCSCGRCEAMPTVEESVCCQEQMRVVEKRERVPGILCITEHHGFQTVCLDEEVLETAHNGYQDHYGEHLGNEWKRYTAYRQFVRWCYVHLGRNVRVPLPSCAVTAIRRAFFSADYTGFMEANQG
ncbi:hypothetical protein Bbelb_036330 [Branchiostoma belcheri]|nr:hypothetical protein Bbelb_036330 [Branchiostoma belcheri]